MKDYNQRIKGLTVDVELNNTIIHNAKLWLECTLENIINHSLQKYSEWKLNSQKNIDNYGLKNT